MKKYSPLYLALFIALVSFRTSNYSYNSETLLNNDSLLTGKWVLVNIEAPDSIDIVPRSIAMQGLKISSEETTKIPYERVVLQDYLQKQLHLGITKFIFNKDNTFSFQREEKLTYSGNWMIQNNELILEYKSAEILNTKFNKLLKLDTNELVLESESHNKTVVFHFRKSEN